MVKVIRQLVKSLKNLSQVGKVKKNLIFNARF